MTLRRMYKSKSQISNKTTVNWFWSAYIVFFGLIGWLIGRWIMN